MGPFVRFGLIGASAISPDRVRRMSLDMRSPEQQTRVMPDEVSAEAARRVVRTWFGVLRR